MRASSSLPAKTQIFTARDAKHAVIPFDDAQTKATYIKTLQGKKLKEKDSKQLIVKQNQAPAARVLLGPLIDLRGWLYQVHDEAVVDAK